MTSIDTFLTQITHDDSHGGTTPNKGNISKWIKWTLCLWMHCCAITSLIGTGLTQPDHHDRSFYTWWIHTQWENGSKWHQWTRGSVVLFLGYFTFLMDITDNISQISTTAYESLQRSTQMEWNHSQTFLGCPTATAILQTHLAWVQDGQAINKTMLWRINWL
jgi:hypothetical protein